MSLAGPGPANVGVGGPRAAGGKGGGVREGAAEGPRSGGPGVSSVVLAPWRGEGRGGRARGTETVCCGACREGGRGLVKSKSWGAAGAAGAARGLEMLLIENCEGEQGYRGIFKCGYWHLEGKSGVARALQTTLFRD